MLMEPHKILNRLTFCLAKGSVHQHPQIKMQTTDN